MRLRRIQKMSEQMIREIINGSAWGHTAEEIAIGMNLTVDEVNAVCEANTENIHTVKAHIAEMEG